MAEEKYAQIEKENGVSRFWSPDFDQYVYGLGVVVESDHQPLNVKLKKTIARRAWTHRKNASSFAAL